MDDRRIKPIKTMAQARREIWRRLDAYSDVLLAYIRKDRPRFESDMMRRHPEMKELFFRE